MGANFHSCCCRCQVKIMHPRGEENKTLYRFYREHYACGKLNKTNLEMVWDYITDEHEDWAYVDLTMKWWDKYVSKITTK